MWEDELNKCKNNISYFIENYCKLLTPNGVENIRLQDYQKKYLKYLNKHRRKNMTQEDILNCKELQNQLSELIKKYYEEYYSYPYQEYEGWHWAKNTNKIIISYSFWNMYDEHECDEYEVTFDELSNFKPNNY